MISLSLLREIRDGLIILFESSRTLLRDEKGFLGSIIKENFANLGNL